MYASYLPQTAFLRGCSTFSSLTVCPGYVQLLILISNDDYYSFCFISNQLFWFSLANLGTSRWFRKSDKSWADICFLKKTCSDPAAITSDFSCCFFMLLSPPAAVVAFSNSVASPVCSSLSRHRWQDHTSFHSHIFWITAVFCQDSKDLWENFQLI